VGGHRGLGDLEVVGKLASGKRVLTEELENPAAGRVGECLEDSIHTIYLAKYLNIVKPLFSLVLAATIFSTTSGYAPAGFADGTAAMS
jgi:hypothetical protein